MGLSSPKCIFIVEKCIFLKNIWGFPEFSQFCPNMNKHTTNFFFCQYLLSVVRENLYFAQKLLQVFV